MITALKIRHQHYVRLTSVSFDSQMFTNLVLTFRLEARCAYGKFNCEDLNPCIPTLCEAGVENYPGPSPRRYVNCTEGCAESQCPRRQVWDPVA